MMTQLAKMRRALIIFYFIGFLFEQTSGNVHKTHPKIIGGRPIDIRFTPFMLSLQRTIESSTSLCGASILSRTWAITALHCFNFSVSIPYYVRAGSNLRNEKGSVHEVTNIYIYDGTKLFSELPIHDIALFRVTPSFEFSETVRPVHLPKSTHNIPCTLLVCGWGYINNRKKMSRTLMGVYVQQAPNEICVNEYPIFEDHHLCYGSKGKDSCFGDSGGALVDKNIIYGIVAFGFKHCGKVPSVYVKVSYYREWIKTVTNL